MKRRCKDCKMNLKNEMIEMFYKEGWACICIGEEKLDNTVDLTFLREGVIVRCQFTELGEENAEA